MGRYSKFDGLPRSGKHLRQLLGADGRSEFRRNDQQTFHSLRHRLGDDQLRVLGRRYAAGESAEALAVEAGIAQSALYEHFARLGIPRKRRFIPENALPELVRLREEGWTYRAIGERYGVTRSAVSSRLVRWSAEPPA